MFEVNQKVKIAHIFDSGKGVALQVYTRQLQNITDHSIEISGCGDPECDCSNIMSKEVLTQWVGPMNEATAYKVYPIETDDQQIIQDGKKAIYELVVELAKEAMKEADAPLIPDVPPTLH